MGAIPCRVCGKYRKWGTIAHKGGIDSPPCQHCGDPGFTDSYEDEAVIEMEQKPFVVFIHHESGSAECGGCCFPFGHLSKISGVFILNGTTSVKYAGSDGQKIHEHNDVWSASFSKNSAQT